MAPHLAQLGASVALDIPRGLRAAADPACLSLALASILRHSAGAASPIEIAGSSSDRGTIIRVRIDTVPLPDERALAFARHPATPMPVTQATDRMPVEPDHVYVIPPNAEMSLLHGTLHLLPLAAPREASIMP